MTVNIALLDQTMAHVEKLEKQWEEWEDSQSNRITTDLRGWPTDRWEQATYCRPVTRFNKELGRSVECGTAACFAGWALVLSGHNLLAEFGDGSNLGHDPAVAAMEELGITRDQAVMLFAPNNTLRGLREIVEVIKRSA